MKNRFLSEVDRSRDEASNVRRTRANYSNSTGIPMTFKFPKAQMFQERLRKFEAVLE